jgi:hypothetical protein
MTDERRYPIGQRLKSKISGEVSTIVAYTQRSEVERELAPTPDERYYVVENAHGQRTIMHHGVLTNTTTPLPADNDAPTSTPEVDA